MLEGFTNSSINCIGDLHGDLRSPSVSPLPVHDLFFIKANLYIILYPTDVPRIAFARIHSEGAMNNRSHRLLTVVPG